MPRARGVVWVVALAAASCDDGSSGQEPAATGQTASAGSGGETSNDPAASGSAGTSGGTQSAAGAGGVGGVGVVGSTGGSAAGSGGSLPECTFPGSWRTVDDYRFIVNEPTRVIGLGSDSRGVLYAIGSSRENNASIGLVRRREAGGSSWANLDWPKTNVPNDIAADEVGNVFITVGLGGGGAAVFRSSNGGAFTSVYPLPLSSEPGESCNTGFVATGPNGVVVAGFSCDSLGWVVAKSTDHGTSWQTDFTFQLVPGKATRLFDVAVALDGTAYATGYGQDADSTPHWITARTGSNAGITSSGVLVDDFLLVAGSPAQARGFASDRADIVVGFASDGEQFHGITRRRNDAGSWETLDTFGAPDTRAERIVAVDRHLFVTGYVAAPTQSMVTRHSADRGASWSSMEDWQYLAGQDSSAGALTRDLRGNIYAGANGRDASGVRWVVRQLDCE